MPRKRKGQRADGLYQCKRKMPDGKVKVFYGHTKTEAEAKYLEAIAKKRKKRKTLINLRSLPQSTGKR